MVREYEAKDYEMITRWLNSKGIGNPDSRFFSNIGYIVNECAVGFLFTTNSKICYLDNIAANPDMTREERNAALHVLIQTLQSKAVKLGYELAVILADLPVMKLRLINQGFNEFKSMTVFYRRLQCS